VIDPNHGLSLTRQAQLLDLSRASLYYEPVGVCEADLQLMRRLDELHLQWPFLGSRMLRDMLRLEGIPVGRKHVATLMRKMGIEAIYRRANTSRRHPRHAIYPYLLRNLIIERPNQVWASDVTYIPMARGFVYLVAVMDWYSRKVLSWRISNSMTADFCVEALEEAIARVRGTGDLQHRPGIAIYGLELHPGSAEASNPHQHGRARCVARQRVRRAAVEVGQVRRGLSACVRLRRGGQGWDPTVLGLLQQPASAHGT
jgi:transposase InsO family protein